MTRLLLYLSLILSFLTSTLLSLPLVQPAPSPTPPPAPIRLQAATFVPGRDETPALPAHLTITGYPEGQPGYYIVQFRGPVQPAWKAQVAALGVQFLAYIPDFAFKVRMTPAQARQVERLPTVSWVGLFHPAYKLSPSLIREGTRLYRVRVERGADTGLVTSALANLGVTVLSHQGDLLLIVSDAALLDSIAQVPDVAWIENF
ncbi:MAG: hypothetical protein D6759_08430, partial [Chloroflexi bacterium]